MRKLIGLKQNTPFMFKKDGDVYFYKGIIKFKSGKKEQYTDVYNRYFYIEYEKAKSMYVELYKEPKGKMCKFSFN